MRAEPAGGQRRLQLDAADDHPFGFGHGRHHLANPAAQHLAVVEVLVDDALGRPVERVAQQPGGMPRERTDLQFDAANYLEMPGQGRPDHADQARREPALGGEYQPAALVGELLDSAGGRHVFGQVEVVHTDLVRGLCDPEVQGVRQTGHDGVATYEGRP